MMEKTPSPYLMRPLPPQEQEVVLLTEPVGGPEGGAHLRDYLRVLRKHLWLMGTFFLGVVLSTVLAVFMMTPLYTAKTTLLIERRPPQVIDIREVLSEPQGPDEYDYYRTQYEILKSRALAARVIREEHLEGSPLFAEKEEGLFARLWAWVSVLFSSPSQLSQDPALGVDARLIDAYLGMLEIDPVRRTRLVRVAFTSPDPELSARVANAHARAYIRQGLGLRTQANAEALKFLEEKLVELKERVEKSEAALNRYRREKGIISLDDKENIVVERLADLNKRLTEAEADRIRLEAQVRLIQSRNYDSLPAVIENTLIQTLKDQLSRLEGEYAFLSTRFKPTYPRLA